jgi:hypothetical protein
MYFEKIMVIQAIFSGLVIDESDNPVEVKYVGDEPCYVVNDNGFLRHIPSEHVDRQVLDAMGESIHGHEDLLSEQAAKMLGQDDIFSRAMINNQIKNIDKQFEALLESGIPEDVRAYLGMLGFKVRINVHGEVLEVIQPGMIDPESE